MQKIRLGDLPDKKFHLDIIRTVNEQGELISFSTSQKLLQKLTHVELKVQNNGKTETILVSIDSLVKNLFLTKFQIMKAALSGQLEALVDEKQKVLKPYAEMLSRFRENSNGIMESKDKGQSTGLRRQIFEHILLHATVHKIGIHVPEMITLSGKQIVVDRTGSKLRITLFEEKKRIGEGSYGTVFKVHSLSSGHFKAMKLSNNSHYVDNTVSLEEISNEQQMLNKVHHHVPQDIKQWIQKAPSTIFQFVSSGVKRIGLIGKKYSEDCYYSITEPSGILKKLPSKDKSELMIKAGQKLMRVLQYLYEQKITHGDIKPQNIFLTRNKEKEIILALSDWGSAQDEMATEIVEALKNFNSTLDLKGTAAYFPVSYENAMRNALGKGNQEEYACYAYQKDIFSLGASLYILMAGDMPYEQDDDERPTTFKTSFETSLKKQGYSEAVSELLKNMMNFNPSKKERESHTDFVKEWDRMEQLNHIPNNSYIDLLDSDLASKYLSGSVSKNSKMEQTTMSQYIFHPANEKGWLMLSTHDKDGLNQSLVQVDCKTDEVILHDATKKPVERISISDLTKRFGTPFQLASFSH